MDIDRDNCDNDNGNENYIDIYIIFDNGIGYSDDCSNYDRS